VLAGQRAEGGEDSGFVPYGVAQALDMALVPAVAELTIGEGGADCLQALPRGRRRAVVAPLPLVATVSSAAPAPRMSAYGPARRGRVEALPVGPVPDPVPEGWEERPARQKPKRLGPKRLRGAAGGSALDRIRAVTEVPEGAGVVLEGPAPDAAARAIYDYLVAQSIVS
jgi:electron transfer flavoprotein beta subunit